MKYSFLDQTNIWPECWREMFSIACFSDVIDVCFLRTSMAFALVMNDPRKCCGST